MLTYTKYSPDEQLTPFLVCYYFFDGIFKEEKVIQSPPTGYTAITFNLKDPYEYYSSSEDKFISCPSSVLVGQQTKNYKIRLSAHIQQIGLVFKPTAIATLFNFTLKELVDKRLSLQNVIGDHALALMDGLKGNPSIEYRLSLLHSFLKEVMQGYEKRINVADLAADIILKNRGNITVERLLDQLCISRRHLEKKFIEKVGLSPKQYCRIARMAPISNIVAHHDKIDWQDMVYKGGFHDQNHFIKDFKALNNTTPSRYHQEHSELVRLIQAKKN